MTRRLLLSYLSITVFVLLLLEVPLAAFYAQRERDRLEANAEHDANVLASFYEDALEQDLPPQPQPAADYGAGTGARVVVVDTAGISVVDTERSPGRDFSTRPEIAIALTGERTTGTRRSDTLDTDLLYVAVPVASSGIVHGAGRSPLLASRPHQHGHRALARHRRRPHHRLRRHARPTRRSRSRTRRHRHPPRSGFEP